MVVQRFGQLDDTGLRASRWSASWPAVARRSRWPRWAPYHARCAPVAPRDIQFDPARHRVLGLERSLLLAFDPTTGERTYLQPDSDPGLVLHNATFLAVDAPADRAFVLDLPAPGFVRAAGRDARAVAPDAEVTRPALLAIALETRTCDLVAALPWEPSSALFHPERRRVLLFQVIAETFIELSAFDLETGAEESFSHAAAALSEIDHGGLAIDARRDRILLYNEEQGLVGMDLATGTVDVISDAAAGPDLAPVRWSPITVDAGRDRALMQDARDTLIAIDLETGAREIVFERDRAAGRTPRSLTVPVVDEAHNRGFLFDGQLGALLLLDFETGMSAIVSM